MMMASAPDLDGVRHKFAELFWILHRDHYEPDEEWSARFVAGVIADVARITREGGAASVRLAIPPARGKSPSSYRASLWSHSALHLPLLPNRCCEEYPHRRSEAHTSELLSLMRNTYAVF